MATSTTNLKITKPSDNDQGWGTTLNANSDQIDGLTPIGSLYCGKAELPSTTLNVRVTAGSYQQSSGSIGTYAGTSTFAVTASTTSNIWLTDAGVLTAGASWPTSRHVRLATVLAGTTTITTVTDQRLPSGSAGGSRTTAVRTVTGTDTATAADGTLRLNAAGGAFTETLPAANTVPGLTLRCIKIDAVATVTIGSTSTINGAATTTLTTQYQSKTFVADGTSNTWNAF